MRMGFHQNGGHGFMNAYQQLYGICVGDPLFPFLFFTVTKGLRYKLSSIDQRISHLHYKNVCAIKELLRLFKAMSWFGLKVNFQQTERVNNNNNQWLEEAVCFLNCKVGLIAFVFFSLPVGVDPRKLSTW
ncbi:hypothetical protein CR513_51889, partial [Mucuna pruriens]